MHKPLYQPRKLQQTDDPEPEPLNTLELETEIKIIYTVSNKYFILTITFACLIVVVIAILITLVILYKKKRNEYKSFLIHKERKMKGDYKKYEYLADDNDEIAFDRDNHENNNLILSGLRTTIGENKEQD